jgi:hypothetical protein
VWRRSKLQFLFVVLAVSFEASASLSLAASKYTSVAVPSIVGSLVL